jgi:glycosyltransferase involved in cell wall biosynthesis
MKLIVVSHKECWADGNSPSGYSTIGGFPQQIKAISELFDHTTVIVMLFNPPLARGAMPIEGKDIVVRAIKAPRGRDLKRKFALIEWLPKNLLILVREIKKADAVHAPVPGDIGTLGILISLILRKRLFIRYCGTWGNKATLANKFLSLLLPRIANGRNIVMATGGDKNPPCAFAPEISWIFSTTVTEAELQQLIRTRKWRRGKRLKLITVSRLDPKKNTESVIRALPLVKKVYSNCFLKIVGDGPCMDRLKNLADELSISNHVQFYGRLDHRNVLNTLLDSDLFVFPTRVKEGFPKVIVEAFACGLPVIATNVSVIPYLVGYDKGIVLTRTEPIAIADAISRIIQDENIFIGMSKRAKKISQYYTLESWKNYIEKKLAEKWGSLRNEKA